jgi:hypothetical protein
MNSIGEFFIGEEQQQLSRHFSVVTDVLSLSIDTILEMNLTNITDENVNNITNSSTQDTTLTYKISLGFICAGLCMLTITGNLLVLITFRRIQTVSIRIFNIIETEI